MKPARQRSGLHLPDRYIPESGRSAGNSGLAVCGVENFNRSRTTGSHILTFICRSEGYRLRPGGATAVAEVLLIVVIANSRRAAVVSSGCQRQPVSDQVCICWIVTFQCQVIRRTAQIWRCRVENFNRPRTSGSRILTFVRGREGHRLRPGSAAAVAEILLVIVVAHGCRTAGVFGRCQSQPGGD